MNIMGKWESERGGGGGGEGDRRNFQWDFLRMKTIKKERERILNQKSFKNSWKFYLLFLYHLLVFFNKTENTWFNQFSLTSWLEMLKVDLWVQGIYINDLS